MEGGHVGGACHRLIGNLLARPPAGGGITGPGTEECLREKKNLLSSGFLAMREGGREREICEVGSGEGVNSRQGQRRTGEKGVGQNM